MDQGPNPRGCFGSTPVDPMHAIEEGIIPNIMSVILDPLPESAKSSLDALAVKIIGCNRWDSEYPRMNFSGGFTSLTQLTADEKVGKMILLWIIMQTTLGRDIITKRCSPTFDEQRVSRAFRFTSNKRNGDGDEDKSEEENSSGNESTTNHRLYTGTEMQIDTVKNCLHDHGLQFVIPWLDQMIPYHRETLSRLVFQIDCTRGKGYKHKLPQESFLDRHVVNHDISSLYFREEINHSSMRVPRPTRVAELSIDATTDQLQELLEMILSFHASYKYSNSSERMNFDSNVRLMMAMIKERINRGQETKNWAISKFHDLLHMVVDSNNFGSHANVDAGKGEHGLKKWAKLPSKTVRTREANLYYHDLATRIYENRLIELAMSTLVPRGVVHTLTDTVDNDDESVTIVLSNLLMKLDVLGPSLLPPELNNYLRGRPNLVFPMEIYEEARYFRKKTLQATVRGTPNYRNSGPWYDCVVVTYENDDGDKREYPFQVHALFRETGKTALSAVGLMGHHKKQKSKLLDEWTYEKSYRIIDLETTSRKVFALTIPAGCYKENGGNLPHRMYVLKDRISDWPVIFNMVDWNSNNESNENIRKRKARR